MHFIALVALVGGVVVIERSWHLMVANRVDAAWLLAKVQVRLLADDRAAAIRFAEQHRSAVARVIRAGLRARRGRYRAEQAVREAQLEVLPALTNRMSWLSSLASLAMLLGLLGTIFGMIGGFHGCGGTVTADQRASVLAKSISIAINSSGFGLLIATPLLWARVFLRAQCDSVRADVALFGARIVNLVIAADEPRLAPSRG